MAKQILVILKNAINARANNAPLNVEALRNIAKEEIQYYVLNFIYHHSQYNKWTMYGGSALRICYDLNRMSVDLDFEIDHACTQIFLNKLKKEVEHYFADKHELTTDILTVKTVTGRGLLLKFSIGEELGLNHHSKQVHVKIDLNYFAPPKAVIERIPINRGQLSFVIKTYNISTLMASKIAAILLRGTRRVGKDAYGEKGRDIYDLLWYMEKGIIPNLNYLRARAKTIDITDFRKLFELVTRQMSMVNNKNLQQDLSPLFLDQSYIENWLAQWHESYLRLVNTSYDTCKIIKLHQIEIKQDFNSDNYLFKYTYAAEENRSAIIFYTVSNYWFEDREGEISTKINDALIPLINIDVRKKTNHDLINRYVTLFNEKNSNYLKKTNNIIFRRGIRTKIICMTLGDGDLRIRTIPINRQKLIACELEDLME